MEDYYAVLGLRKPPSEKEIRAGYQRLIANYRPHIIKEMGKEEQARAKRELQKIKKAYQTLSDPAKRFHYDNPTSFFKEPKRVKEKRTKIEEEGIGTGSRGPVWLMTYADMVTLLLAFFVFLLSFASISQNKFQELMQSVKSGFGFEDFEQRLIDMEPLDIQEFSPKLGEFLEQTREFIEEAGMEEEVQITSDDRGTVITISDPVLFAPGEAELNPSAYPLIEKIAKVVKEFSQPVTIEGHTDNTPVHNEKYRNNRELSVHRALSVLERLTEHHEVLPHKVSVDGYGEHMPLFPNDTPEHRAKNRRVEIVFRGWY